MAVVFTGPLGCFEFFVLSCSGLFGNRLMAIVFIRPLGCFGHFFLFHTLSNPFYFFNFFVFGFKFYYLI